MRILDFHFMPIPSKSNLWILPNSDFITDGIIAQIKLSQLRLINTTYQVFCGMYPEDPHHRVYATVQVHPCDIILEFGVGNHQGMNLSQHVYDQMLEIYNIKSFRPYFVDYGSLYCIFEERIEVEEAKEIVLKFEFGIESYVSMVDDLYPEGDDVKLREPFEDDIVRLILRTNEIHLWWD